MFGLFKKDPEVERVMIRLTEQLEKVENWTVNTDESIIHDSYNIVLNRNAILSPDHIWIPFRWKKIIKKRVQAVYRIAEIDKLHFMYDVIDGKYPYYVSTVGNELSNWLKENATEDQYMIISDPTIRQSGLYIKDPELAMGYKLTFEN